MNFWRIYAFCILAITVISFILLLTVPVGNIWRDAITGSSQGGAFVLSLLVIAYGKDW